MKTYNMFGFGASFICVLSINFVSTFIYMYVYINLYLAIYNFKLAYFAQTYFNQMLIILL